MKKVNGKGDKVYQVNEVFNQQLILTCKSTV